jgi:hypothetical protein
MPRQPKLWQILGTLPTQQAFAVLVMAMWIPTCVQALRNRSMNPEWLSTLLGLSFTAVLHYGVKRWSFKPGQQDADVEAPPPPAPGASP